GAIAGLGGTLASHPLFFGRLLSALDLHLGDPLEIAVVGDPAGPATAALLAEVREPFLPNKVVAAGPPGSTEPALMRGRDAAGAYVCHGFVCSTPVTTPVDLRAELGLTSPTGDWRSI